MKTEAHQKCLIEKCGRQVSSRGLCIGCYRAASKLVSSGKTSWMELEKLLLALPIKETESRRGLFLKAFYDAKEPA